MSLCPILSDLRHESCSGAQGPLTAGGPAHTPELRVTLQGEHCKVNNGSDSRRGRTAPRVSEALGEVTPAFSVALGRFLGFFFLLFAWSHLFAEKGLRMSHPHGEWLLSLLFTFPHLLNKNCVRKSQSPFRMLEVAWVKCPHRHGLRAVPGSSLEATRLRQDPPIGKAVPSPSGRREHHALFPDSFPASLSLLKAGRGPGAQGSRRKTINKPLRGSHTHRMSRHNTARRRVSLMGPAWTKLPLNPLSQ